MLPAPKSGCRSLSFDGNSTPLSSLICGVTGLGSFTDSSNTTLPFTGKPTGKKGEKRG